MGIGPMLHLGDHRLEARATRRGFTLIEVILSMAVLILIVSVGILSLGSFSRERRQMEAAIWYETVLRDARSQAMIAGRTVRLTFDADSGRPSLWGESDPLAAPGRFDLPLQPWSGQPPQGFRLVSCLRNESRSEPRGWDLDEQDQDLQTLSFYADGSADWAQLEVRAIDEADTELLIVEVNGFTGLVRSWTVSDAEWDELSRP